MTCHLPRVRENWGAPLLQKLLGASGGASGAPPPPSYKGLMGSSLTSCLQTTLKVNLHLSLLSLWTKSCGCQRPQSLVLLFLHRMCTAHMDFRDIPPRSRLKMHGLKIHPNAKLSRCKDKMSLVFSKKIFMIFLTC